MTFTGFISSRAAVATLLATADVVLAPGPVETFGLAALEALAGARAHAERFGWPAAVRGFLAVHAVAARVEMAEEAVR